MLSATGREPRGHSLAARRPPGPHLPRPVPPGPVGEAAVRKASEGWAFKELLGSLPALLMPFAWASVTSPLSSECVKRETFRQIVPCGHHRGNPCPLHRAGGAGVGVAGAACTGMLHTHMSRRHSSALLLRHAIWKDLGGICPLLPEDCASWVTHVSVGTAHLGCFRVS